MPAFSTIILVPLLLSGVSGAGRILPEEAPVREHQVHLAQLSIEQRVIIRIPAMPPRSSEAMEATPAPAVRWKQSKGPRCLPLNLIRAAVVTDDSGVTMVVSRAERYLAHLGRACRPADFYSGFYISPNKDGVLCAGRDTLHARNGSACEIQRFSRMTVEDASQETSGKVSRDH